MTKHSKSARCMALLVLMALVPAGAVRGATAGQSEIVDGVAAIVNDKVITYSEVRDYVQPVVQQLRRAYGGQELLDKVRAAQLDALNNLIDRELIIQEFNQKGYNFPPTVVDEQLNNVIANDFGGDRAAFVKTLEAERITLKQYRDQLRDRIIVQAMRSRKTQQEVVASPYKIEKYYQEHLDDYKVEDQIKLRMIFIKKIPVQPVTATTGNANTVGRLPSGGAGTNATSGDAAYNLTTTNTSEMASTTNAPSVPAFTAAETNQAAPTSTAATNEDAGAETNAASVAAADNTNATTHLVWKSEGVSTNPPATSPPPPPDPRRKLGEEIVAKLDAGDSFESMAKVYSEGREAKEGGEWGWIGRDVLRKELNDVAFSLKPGQHSRLIETDEGYYVLEVNDVKPAHTRLLTEVRDQIERILLEQQRTKMQEEWVKELRAKAYLPDVLTEWSGGVVESWSIA